MASPDGSTGAKRDELLLRTPCDVEEQDDLWLGRIHDEIERGFDALRDIDDARAFVIMPGGFGTLDEMFESLVLIQTNRIKHFPTILVDSQHWAPLLDWIDHNLEDDGMITSEDKELLVTADSPDEVCDHVRRASSNRRSWPRPGWWPASVGSGGAW